MSSCHKIRVLLIEDETYDVRRIQNTIAPFKDRILIEEVVSDGQSALDLLESGPRIDVVIMDFQICGGLRGEALIRKIKEIDETIQIIVVTKMTMRVTDFDFANKLLEAGAMWYCSKYPSDIDNYIYQPTDFILSIHNAYEKRRLHRAQLKSDRKLQQNIQKILEKKTLIGESAVMRRLQKQIEDCAQTEVPVLISGESGTGKELVATNIHYKSARKLENFVPINCASLPENLVESELFGFEKGAFTGAQHKKPGLFELANKGTVFLDEISELPLLAQAKLLRVLQEGDIDKIGRTDNVNVDVRVIAASNKDLREEIKRGRFREDLFYRLNVVNIRIPTLRERRADIPLLLHHFLAIHSDKLKLLAPVLLDEGLDILVNFDWPGNVRQLENVTQMMFFSVAEQIDACLAKSILGIVENAGTGAEDTLSEFFDKDDIRPWRELRQKVRDQYFRYVRNHASSDAEAARILGLAPPNYYRMCKRIGLK